MSSLQFAEVVSICYVHQYLCYRVFNDRVELGNILTSHFHKRVIPAPLIRETVALTLPTKDGREVVVELLKVAEKKTSRP